MVRIRFLFLITLCMTFELSAADSDEHAKQGAITAIVKPDSGIPDPLRDNQASDFLRFTDIPIVTVHQLRHSPPSEARKAFSKGRSFLEKHQADEAITWLGKAVAIDPEYTDAYNDLAAVYMKTGRTDKAILFFNSAIHVDPIWALAYYNLAIAYLSVNEVSQAERTARRMAEIDAGSAQAAFVLGLSLTLQNRFTSETQAALTRAEFIFPEATLLLGRILAGRGEIQAAKLKILTYLASPAVWGREMASEWLALLDGKR
jgi:Flp pilus assembly protein TadD